MLTPPFFAEVPDDLGCDATWLGRGVMPALTGLRRQHPQDDLHGAHRDRGFVGPSAAATFHARDRHAQVQAFLERKWVREPDGRLIKEPWARDGHRDGVSPRRCVKARVSALGLP
jgi:hypothetical protein